MHSFAPILLPESDERVVELACKLEHDLRNPLTTVCNYAECLAYPCPQSPLVRMEYSDIVVAQGRRVARIAAQYAVVVGHDPLGNVGDHNAVDLLSEIAKDIELYAEIRRQVIAVGDIDDLPRLRWPLGSLQCLFSALVDGALDAAASDSVIALRLERINDGIAVNISLETRPAWDFHSYTDCFAIAAAARLLYRHGGALLLGDGSDGLLQAALPAQSQLA